MPTASHYRSLVELIDRITDSHDVASVLSRVLDTLAEHFATPQLLILLPDHRGLLRAAAWRGLAAAALDELPTITLDPADTPRLADFQARHGFALVQTVELLGKPRGLVLLGRRGDGADYHGEDLDYIATVADTGALALDYQQLIQRLNDSVRDLDHKVSQLSSLFELSKEFSGTLDSEVIGQLLVFTLIQQFRVEGFAVLGLRESPPRIIEARLPRQRLREALDESALEHLDSPLYTAAVARQYPALAELGVALIVPVQVFGRISGAILLGRRRDGATFSKADVDYVAAVGSLAIIAAENARLFQTALDKERMEQDLAVARTIQQRLLPRELPTRPGIQLAACNHPAYQVGGDYYDVIDLGDDGLVLAIADVAGKGVHSALLMANLQAFLKALCQQPPALDEATARLNAYVAEHAPPEMFVTFFWGVLSSDGRHFSYVNAGHNPPLLLRHGEAHWLDTDGLVLGALNPAPPFSVANLQLQSGDTVVAYTDGITEARDGSGELFGETRLTAALQDAGDCPADSLLASLNDAVAAFCGEMEQADDITCWVLRVC